MDKEQLISEVKKFAKQCAFAKRPINSFCLNEAYPGDSSTSYFLDIKADWIEEGECFDAISFFTDVMFDIMTVEARRKIFSIRVFTNEEALHCDSGEISHVINKAS